MHNMSSNIHRVLVATPRGLTLVQLASRFKYGRTAVRHVLECLETEGFVRREERPTGVYWVAC